jgi:hypothetical protein
MGEMRKGDKTLVGKPEGKRPPGRPRHRWEGNIKIGVMEIGLKSMNWVNLAQNRDWWRGFVNTVMNNRVT